MYTAVEDAAAPLSNTARDPLLGTGGEPEVGLGKVLRAKAFTLVLILVSINVALFITLFSIDAAYSAILSPGLLAYTYGLRHAVDAGALQPRVSLANT